MKFEFVIKNKIKGIMKFDTFINESRNLSDEELISLCDFVEGDNVYVSKSGQDYINALGQIFSTKNRNDKPFTVDEIVSTGHLFDKFKNELKKSTTDGVGLDEFQLACELNAQKMGFNPNTGSVKNEKIVADIKVGQMDTFNNRKGCVYILTCVVDGTEYVVKIGQTRKTFKDRLASYNCGNVNNRKSGNCSTTNYRILQSILAAYVPFNLYLCPCGETQKLTWHGIESEQEFATSMSIAVEDILVKEFKNIFGKIPLANIHANAGK